MNIIRDTIEKEQQVVHVVRPHSKTRLSINQLEHYLEENKEDLDGLLLKSGAILFRGFDINNQSEFLKVRDLLGGSTQFNYVDGNSPRTKLSHDVYTSTEYPKEFSISLHSELSYSHQWPEKIIFFCETPAKCGGETPIVDCRLMLKKIGPGIASKFEELGVKYTRYLRGNKGFGKSWMETFETHDKKEVEMFCRENEIEFYWEEDFLFLGQTGHGVVTHPITREKVWFNQANQFHPTSLPEEIYMALKMKNSKAKHKFPQYAYYGNGDEIQESTLRDITNLQFETAVKFKWEQGDVLLLDNLLMAHGRMPFEGARKVYVSMF